MSYLIILLSLEKFLSNTEPTNPTIPNVIAVTPIFLPINMSNSNPATTPTDIPTYFPANNPITKTNIINKLGIILLLQLFNLQIVHGNEYREKSNKG